jgi:hypothetical protein
MAKPSGDGTDDDLVLSPYPHQEQSDPEQEVQEIVGRWVSSTYQNPMVVKFLADPQQKDLFFEVFARQANIIKSRCQAFDDAHVTVYDKVLLCLTDNGNRFDKIPAQEYFCEEFLGINSDGDPVEGEKILNQSLILKAILPRGKDIPELQ